MESETGSFGYTRRVLRGLVRKADALVSIVEASVVAVSGEGYGMVGGTGAQGVRAILARLRVDGGGVGNKGGGLGV